MKRLTIILLTFLFTGTLIAQKRNSVDTSRVAFFSKEASGVFKTLTGSIVTNENNMPTEFYLSIEVASLKMSSGMQTKHAKSSEWFHASKYPSIQFKSNEVIKNEEGLFAKGELTFHGVSKIVTLPITMGSENNYTSFMTKFRVKRKEFGMALERKEAPIIQVIAKVFIEV
jgi:polyisoprenoid-binding protein YceI